MKQNWLKLAAIILLSGAALSSCKKDEAEPETNNPGANPGSDFNWKTSSGSQVTADSAYYYGQFTTVFAFKNGLSNSIEINLSALSAGNYSISSTTGNALTFVTASTTYTANSGYCNISGVSNNKLAGTFSVALSGGTLTSVSGSFSGIAQR